MYIPDVMVEAGGVDSPDPVQSEASEPTTEPKQGETAEPTTEPKDGKTTEAKPAKKSKNIEKAFSARLSQATAKIEKKYAPHMAVLEAQAKAANMSLEDYLVSAEAKASGKTPEVIKAERERDAAKQKLAQIELKDRWKAEETKLTSDPKIGQFVTDNLEEIKEIAESTGTNLTTGLALVASKMLPELLANANPEVHIQKYLKELKEGKTNPVEIGGGASAAPGQKSIKTFDDAKASAMSRL